MKYYENRTFIFEDINPYKISKSTIIVDIQKLKDYFTEFNRQVRELGGDFGVDTSGTLDKIMDSIENLQFKESVYGIVDIWNANAMNGRYTFCREAALYFMAMEEVPDFNARQIVEAAETKSLGHIADSFRKHALKLKEMRETPVVDNPSR